MNSARAALCAVALLAACTSGAEPGPTPTPDPTPEPALGQDPSVRAEDDEARAGVLRTGVAGEAALFEGLAAEARPGDVVLYNSEVRFAIQGAYRSHGYVDTGGQIIDADLVRPEGQLGQDTLDDMLLSFGIGRLVHADSVEIVADGSAGGDAIVRAVGTDVGWAMTQGVAETPEPLLGPLNLLVETTYALAPGASVLRITTLYVNEGEQVSRFNPTDGFVVSSEDMLSWAPDQGLGPPEGDDLPAIGMVGRRGAPALSFWPLEGVVDRLDTGGLLDTSGIRAFVLGWRDLAPGDSFTLERAWSLGPDTLHAEAGRWRAQGAVTTPVGGRVTDGASGIGVAGARVHVVSAEEPPRVLGYAVTTDDGTWAAEVPAGSYVAWPMGVLETERVDLPAGAGSYGPFVAAAANARVLAALDASNPALAIPLAEGRAPVAGLPFVAAGVAVLGIDAALTAPATLHLRVEDAGGQPLGAHVQLSWTGGAAPQDPVPVALREALGLPALDGSAGQAWLGDGAMTLTLQPGTYDLVVSHSHRHERGRIDALVLASGEEATATVVLEEVVPRDGWMSMDSHLHAAPSTDGKLPMEDRLIVCAAAGIDLPVTTDHDRMADYGPLNAALGLASRMRVVPGVEVSSVRRGHVNLFPVEPDPAAINGGAPSWWDPLVDTDAYMARIRAAGPKHALVHVNHGRGAGLMDFAAFDWTIGEPRVQDLWSWDFDLFELVNGRSRGNWEEERRDWFSWLDTGRRKIPTGVSDSHGRGSPCGYAHTDVWLDGSDPAAVTPEALSEAVSSGRVVVSGGLTLRATLSAGGVTVDPGQTVTGASGDLHIVVRAPSWIVPTVVRAWRNAELLREEAVSGDGQDALWHESTWTVDAPADADAWFVVEVEGTQGLGTAWGNAQPYAASNAFFLDVAGDGWTAPGR